MDGFRFLTISVAPRPTVSGRPPPAVSMAVGQFFNPEDGMRDLSAQLMLLSAYSPKEMLLEEDHPLAYNLSFGVSLGLLPVSLSLKSTGCGINKSELSAVEIEDKDGRKEFEENSRLCKLRCFPPVAIAWDPTSGLYFFPNLDGQTIVVDSSPALWSSTMGSEETTVFLMVDPHCSYKMDMAVSESAAASRFLLLYGLQMVGFSFAVVFFAVMQQAHAWDLDLPVPSMMTAVESNLRTPLPFLLLGFLPVLISLFISLLKSQPIPPVSSFTIVSILSYLLANGSIFVLILVSQLIFYAAAVIHVFIKSRWQGLEENLFLVFVQRFPKLSSSLFPFKVIQVLRVNAMLVTTLMAISSGCFVHPVLGLCILLLAHALCCHNALCSSMTASSRSHPRKMELFDYKDEGNDKSHQFPFSLQENSSNSPNSSKSFGDTQLELFHHRHGLLILHLLAALMFVPSFVAWLQRMGLGHSFPWFLDSVLCSGVILHGIFNTKPEFNSLFSFLSILGKEMRLDFVYLLAGYHAYLSGLNLAPYRVFYAMAAIGFISSALRMLERRSREKGEPRFGRKKHSHRH
uniref:Uncharacterized protein LOC105140193 isoform X1 n=2 Tax=Rhizophora mucronata TaxID=61149 RepID=A0A2P2J4X6_RHIMU